MLEYISGPIATLTPAYAVIEAGGLGYMATISVNSFNDLSNSQGAVKLYVHEVIRDDAHLLYGFTSEAEREMFRLLIGVSGVGSTTAILILSGLSVAQLEEVIRSGEHARLKSVKGIGTKTAQRIIVDLKDRIKPALPGAPGSETAPAGAAPAGRTADFDDALAAMLALGVPKPAATKALLRVFDSDPAVKVGDAVKKAIALM